MSDDDVLFRNIKFIFEKAHENYHFQPCPQTWQKFYQALKQYRQALEDREIQKALRYHERLQRLGKKPKRNFS